MTGKSGHDQKEDWERLDARQRILILQAEFLSQDETFSEELQMIREQYKIPRLDPSRDARAVHIFMGDEETADAISLFLDELPSKKKEQFEKDLYNLISKYELPVNFIDWLRWWTLYREKPKMIPIYNFELPFDVVEYPEHVKKLGLTTQEKDFVRWYLRWKFNVQKGRRPKKYALLFKKFDEVLAKSKNRKRTPRTFRETLEILKRKKEFVKTFNVEKNEYINTKKRYVEVVGELTPEAPAEVDRRSNAKFRQRVSRLNKRKNKYLKKKAGK